MKKIKRSDPCFPKLHAWIVFIVDDLGFIQRLEVYNFDGIPIEDRPAMIRNIMTDFGTPNFMHCGCCDPDWESTSLMHLMFKIVQYSFKSYDFFEECLLKIGKIEEFSGAIKLAKE